MAPWAVILINAGVAFGVAFGGALAAGYSVKEALVIALATLTGNQSGLHQRKPGGTNVHHSGFRPVG